MGESCGLCRLSEGEEKNMAGGRGLAVQLREKRKKFKGRVGCAVEGAEKKIQGGDVRGRREACGWFVGRRCGGLL